MNTKAHIEVCGLTMAYGSRVVQRDLTFSVGRGDIFIIMGDSGSGKSTLMRHMIGLQRPAAGVVLINGRDIWKMDEEERTVMMRCAGITYQGGALWSSMTVAENVAIPLEEFTDLDRGDIDKLVALKLQLVGLGGFQDYYPSELSGGMQKRAALARAIALDPEILFFDEPSAGLDPITSKRLDDLIAELRNSLGTTVVIVTHELPSILGIGTDAIFLDADLKTISAQGDPRELSRNASSAKVREFFSRGISVEDK